MNSVLHIDPTTGNGTAFYSTGLDDLDSLAIEPDGDMLVVQIDYNFVGPPTYQLLRIDHTTGMPSLLVDNGPTYITHVATSADGRIFASQSGGSQGDVLCQLDPNTGASTPPSFGNFLSSPTYVHDLTVYTNGDLLAVIDTPGQGSFNHSPVQLLRMDAVSHLQTLLVPDGMSFVTYICSGPDGHIFASGSQDTGSDFVWSIDPLTGNHTVVWSADQLAANTYISGIAVEPDGDILVATYTFDPQNPQNASNNRVVRLNPLSRGQTIVIPNTQTPVFYLAVSPIWYGIDISYSGVIKANRARPINSSGSRKPNLSSSAPPSISDFQSIKSQGYNYVVVQGWGGKNPNQYASAQLANARTARLLTAGYCYLNFNSAYDGARQVRNAIVQFGDEAAHLNFLAIDVETNDWSQIPLGLKQVPPDPSAQLSAVNLISQAVSQTTQVGLRPIIYTKKSDWKLVTGNSTLFNATIPLWHTQITFGDDVTQPDLGNASNTFGGWTDRIGKQYLLDKKLTPPGILGDLNVFWKDVFSGEPHFKPLNFHLGESKVGNNLALSWSDPSLTLEEISINDDFTENSEAWTASPKQTSPVVVGPGGIGKFYRVR